MSALIDIETQPTYDFAAIVAANIRAQASRIGFNQSELARELGYNQGAVNQRWRGKRQWQLDDLSKVAAVLGTTPWELVQPMGDIEKLPQLDSNQQPFD
ncbi:MAG: helix-turn-helix transcriptional regulator [Actinomycetaceae bacterium]|nr:helix-turn-helix domain-containing protein [Arcanobacterium sp.]MDD7686541.1 helix-turn-helix transcriptional regulator [Actinomycetaceae bacterium]MDY5272821.1 helix-turn-helix transcriptional regulator [Arcanobacterium sp.]